MQNCIKININHSLINAVGKMAEYYSHSTDQELINHYVNHCLNIKVQFNRIKYILSLINNGCGLFNDSRGSILEIGSGIGTSCLSIQGLTKAKVYGVEPANNTYSPLRKCIDEFIIANPHILYESLLQGGENISLPDESIDFIYSLEVLEHVQNPQKVLFEVYRLLRKGGKAYIATNNYDSFYEGHYKKFWNPFISPNANKHRYIKQGLSPQLFNELNFITKKQLMSNIKNCGFSHFMFNPPVVSNQLAVELEAEFPDNFLLPSTGKNIKPTKLHLLIEKPRVAELLSRFDREYKLYVLITK